jgi:hypothetical protein
MLVELPREDITVMTSVFDMFRFVVSSAEGNTNACLEREI